MKKIGILLLLFITSNLSAQNNSKDETEITKLIQSNWEINNRATLTLDLCQTMVIMHLILQGG